MTNSCASVTGPSSAVLMAFFLGRRHRPPLSFEPQLFVEKSDRCKLQQRGPKKSFDDVLAVHDCRKIFNSSFVMREVAIFEPRHMAGK